MQISAAKKSTLEKNFDKLLDILVTKGWISSISADRCQVQYRKLLDDKKFLDKSTEFNMLESRLDDFYMHIIDDKDGDLIAVIKLCLVLSHGNAHVESGFSINEQLLHENEREITVIAQRIVYEGILSVDINDSMMRYVNKSHSLYIQELEKNKKHQTEAEKKRVARKRRMLT